MRILIIEDEARLADSLDRVLRAEGHFCVSARDGAEGLALAQDGDFDIILLDLVLPGMHGLEVCQKLRLTGSSTPILVLTALDGTANIIRGLRMGADEYLTKPFDLEELLARIEALGRRGLGGGDEKQQMNAGRVELDRDALRVFVDGESVHLTAKELAILELLMSHPNTLFSRERILNNVWGLQHDPHANVVDVYVGRLRKKIDPDSGPSVIETVRGLGYRIRRPARERVFRKIS